MQEAPRRKSRREARMPWKEGSSPHRVKLINRAIAVMIEVEK